MDSLISGLNKKLLVGLLVIVVVISACYVIENLSREAGTRSGKIITVAKNGQPVSLLGIDVLKEVAQQEKQTGSGEILLSKALLAAGVEDYKAVRVSGTGLESVYVSRNLADEQVLRFNQTGSADLYWFGSKNQMRVKSVNLIEID